MPSGNYLEGVFNLNFELNNQVFSTSSSSALPGSFSFPFDVPLTVANRGALGNPDIIQNADLPEDFDDVEVYCYGVLMFIGTLTIMEATPDKARINIVSNPMRQLRDVPLNELDLGGVRDIGDTATMLSHALATANDPLDYDYVFFPILNELYLYEPTADLRCRFQNYYSVDAGAFQVDDDYPALMPFIRVEYLLTQIFSGMDYTFSNKFQVNDELRRLCLFNIRSLWDSTLSETIDLRNHVSTTKSTVFLRNLVAVFNLGLFTNIFKRTINLTPVRDILSRPPLHDWTDHVLWPHSIAFSKSDVPDYYAYREESEDAALERYTAINPRPSDDDVIATVDELFEIDALPSHPEGIYYVTTRWAYYYYRPALPASLRFEILYSELGLAPVRSGEKFELPMPTLFDFWHFGETYPQPPSSPPIGAMPHVQMAGTVTYTPTGATDPVEQENTTADRLVWYRGMQQDNDLVDYPRACSSNFNNLGLPADDYALRVDGDTGIYSVWWELWHTMLQSGKHVTQQFALPIGELIAFSFEDKIRVGNMDYFVKKLRVGKPLGQSRLLVEASMVSVI